MIKTVLIYAIKAYQNIVSPKKGFRCAHSVVHGGTGCSGAVIKILKENSLFSCYGLIKKRFSDCTLANEKHKETQKKKKSKCNKCTPDFEDCGDCLDVGDCF